MKKLLLFVSIGFWSHLATAQINITCQAYYMSTPNRNLPNVAVTARSATGTTLGSCNTGSSGSCVISGTSALLTASYQFTNGYVVNERLTSGDTIVRAAFDESYVRESPTITREIEDAPSSSYPKGFVQTGNYVYYQAFTPTDGMQVRRHNIISNTHETIPLPLIEIGKVSKLWLAGSRILVYADRQFYVITNPTSLTPSMSAALAGVPQWPDPEKSVLVSHNYLYFSSREGVTELTISTGTFADIPLSINANADNFIFHAATNHIYFTASNATGQDRQLWRVLNGGYTPYKISNLNSPTGAGIIGIVEWNGRLYFSAETPALGRELYRTIPDGSAVELFLDIETGSTSSNVARLTPAVSVALGQNELYAETHQLGLVRISTTGVVNQVVDAVSGDDIRALDKITYSPSRGILYCYNGSAQAFYEHVYGNLNATNLTVSNNVDLYYGYNGIEMLPFGNGILFKGKNMNNNDTYLGQILYVPNTIFGITYWIRFVTKLRTFPNTLLPSLFNQPKLANLTSVGSRVYFSAIGDAVKGFEPWYYDSSAMPSVVETPQVNTKPLGIVNYRDMESVSYGNYFYYNAENFSEGGLYNGIVGFNESIQKTLGTQNVENFSRLSVFYDITSLKMAGSRLFASSVNTFNSEIESVDLATNASSIFPPPTADIRDLDNSSAIGNTLYFLSLPRAAGSSFRRLWRTDGTTAGTYTIDTENTNYTGTYA
jgi:ELWxxDGT repeat protein